MTTKIFFDTEFTGLHQDTTLISIGLISEKNDTFYGVCNDFDWTQVTPWIRNNVIQHLDPKVADVYGEQYEVQEALDEWLLKIPGEIEFVSDVCHYDFVLLINLLWGDALHMPGNICPACYDINQDISQRYGMSLKEAFDINREAFLEGQFPTRTFEGVGKHMAIWDAAVIQGIYNTNFLEQSSHDPLAGIQKVEHTYLNSVEGVL